MASVNLQRLPEPNSSPTKEYVLSLLRSLTHNLTLLNNAFSMAQETNKRLVTWQCTPVAVGSKYYFRVPSNGRITKVSLLGDVVGSVQVDIWKDTWANHPPTVADTICGGNKPKLTAASSMKDSTLTGWSTSVNMDDVLVFNIDSYATLTYLTVQLEITV